jgi:hypothetical protein
MQYKGAGRALPSIAEELGVDVVVEGSVQREGNRIRIMVQLIEAATDAHLWAENYERDMGGVLALVDEVARGGGGDPRSDRAGGRRAQQPVMCGRLHFPRWYRPFR